MKLTGALKEAISQRLLRYDPGIMEIVQFGSSVYAPRHANDVDILIFTKRNKGYDRYFECLKSLESPFEFDLVIKRIGEELNKSFAYQVFGACEIIYGDGSLIQKAMEQVDPTFDEAHAAIETAKKYMEVAREAAKEAKSKWIIDRHIRDAFNALAHASRMASMAYLSTRRAGWEGIKMTLPRPLDREFDKHFKILHVRYFYDGRYPKKNVERSFDYWTDRVEGYIRRLEKRAQVKPRPCRKMST